MEDPLIKEFIAESFDGLDRMERCLTALETAPQDALLLGEIFRTVHTIKGTTGFLGFKRMETLAHAGESLLGAMRDGTVGATEEIVGALLDLMDGFRTILQLIDSTGGEGERKADGDGPLIEQLISMATERPASAPAARLDLPAAAIAVELEEPSANDKPLTRTNATEKSLRIDVDVLNRMMNLVGELVLTRNQLLQSSLTAENFPKLARRLDAVTADLRETVMQARMQPVGQLFGKFPRMVRDLARVCGKSVRIEFSGQETGLDKSLLEAIKDPLTHAMRNAIDHGIEASAERTAKGKPAEGLIRLRAFHQSGSVVIELADDGAGISIERVLAKAVERSLITESEAAAMTEREALQLVFLPGFSTAAAVTHVSGRGVGMDVVRLNVEAVGGSVELESRPGAGTTLRMRVPLTLAIVPALIVRSGEQSFCLPQGALAELVYIPWREAACAFEKIGEAELYRLRDKLLPVVWLDRLLQYQPEPGTLCAASDGSMRASHGFYLAVLESEQCRYGLVVDDLLAPEEIVVKPLSQVLREIGLFSGATVLGNGTLALILDVAATAERAGVRSEASKANTVLALASEDDRVRESFLIFEGAGSAGQRERMALPLDAVERIETVPLGNVEFAGGHPLLQYRGELIPLEDTDGVLFELAAQGPDAMATVLICRRPGGSQPRQRIGMVVRQVLDVSNGSMMDGDASVCQSRLAMVKERLTVVHGAFLPAFAQSQWEAAA